MVVRLGSGSGTTSGELTLMFGYPIVSYRERGYPFEKVMEYKWLCETTYADGLAPKPGESCPDDPWLYCQYSRIETITKTYSYVYATYATAFLTLQNQPGYEEEFNDSINAVEEDSEGVEYRVSHSIFGIKKIKSKNQWSNADRWKYNVNMVNHINALSWRNYPAYKLLAHAPVDRKTAEGVWEINFYFEYKQEGWDATRYSLATFSSYVGQ